MRDYKVKKLLIKDRGITKDTKGIFKYSKDKLDKFERNLIQDEANIRVFNEFKEKVLNAEEVPVSSSIYPPYKGFVLENNMIINIKKDKFMNDGEYVSTPMGRVKFVQLPIGIQCHIDNRIDEDVDAMTDNIYDLDYNSMTESLFFGAYRFRLKDNKIETPRLVVKVPSIAVKREYQHYFYLCNEREKLFYKLKNQVEISLRRIIEMDEKLPEDFAEEHKDWTPEKRVYSYACKHPSFIHEA